MARKLRGGLNVTLEEAEAIQRALNGTVCPRLSRRVEALVARLRNGVVNSAERARARHELVRQAYMNARRAGEAWNNQAFADSSGISCEIVRKVVRDFQFVDGLTGVRLAGHGLNARRNAVSSVYATLRDANQWGPWQLQPVAALVGCSVDQVKRSVKLAVRRYPEGERWEGGLSALLRDLRNVEYRDRNVEAAE